MQQNAQLYRSFEQCFPRQFSFFTFTTLQGTWPPPLTILSSDVIGSFLVKGEGSGEFFFTLTNLIQLYPAKRAEFRSLLPEYLNHYLAEFLINMEQKINLFLFLESPKIFGLNDLSHLAKHLSSYQDNKNYLKFDLALNIIFENISLECHLLGALRL